MSSSELLSIEELAVRLGDNPGEYPKLLAISGDATDCLLELEVTEELDGFRGHFPGNPVLAGIVQLHWAARLSSHLFGYQVEPLEIKQLKFKKVVQPPATLSLKLRQATELKVYFEFFSQEHSHSSGQMIYSRGPR